MDDFPRYTIRLTVNGWQVWDRLRAGVWTNGPSKEWCQREAERLNRKTGKNDD